MSGGVPRTPHVSTRTLARIFSEEIPASVHGRIIAGWHTANDVRLWREGGVAHWNYEHYWVYHSPAGIEWGYGGSGPADLALNILGLFVVPPEAWRLHQQYKWEVIVHLPHEGGVIRTSTVRGWIFEKWYDERQRQAVVHARPRPIPGP